MRVFAGSERRVTTALRFSSDAANEQFINLTGLLLGVLMAADTHYILWTRDSGEITTSTDRSARMEAGYSQI